MRRSPASPVWRIRELQPLSRSKARFDVVRDDEGVVGDEDDLGRRLIAAAAPTEPARAAASAARDERPVQQTVQGVSRRSVPGANGEQDAALER